MGAPVDSGPRAGLQARGRAIVMLAMWLVAAGCALDDADGDGISARVDCNDQDPTQGRPVSLFVDGDGDGYGSELADLGCPGNAWLVANALDCDDTDPDVRPGGIEIGCDGIDNDCDPQTADGPAVTAEGTWASVQEAIDNAGHHETVQLCASTIDESVVIRAPLTLAGAGAELTVIDGSSSDAPVIELQAQATLRDLTVTGGTGGLNPNTGERQGGGVLVRDGDLFLMERCTVRGNMADAGGGIAVLSTTPTFVWSTTISSNVAIRGGGLLVIGATSFELRDSLVIGNSADDGGGAWLSGSASVVQSRIEDNTAVTGGGLSLAPAGLGPNTLFATSSAVYANRAARGGGVYGSGVIYDLVVEANEADEGAGLFLTGTTTINGVELLGNHALVGDGGGVYSHGPAFVSEGTTFVGNTAAGDGGGLSLHGSSVAMVDGRLEDNIASRGGGLAIDGDTCAACPRLLYQSELRNNVATAVGGAIYAGCSTSLLSLQETSLVANQAANGAGVMVDDADVALIGTLMLGQDATAADGSAVHLAWSGCSGGSRVASDGSVFASNAPADVSLGSLLLSPAPTSFECRSDALGDRCE